MITTTIKTDSKDLTISVGDRVQHHSGITGVVMDINEHKFCREGLFPGEESWCGSDVYIIVREDLKPRQRKYYPSARWDGIVAVLA